MFHPLASLRRHFGGAAFEPWLLWQRSHLQPSLTDSFHFYTFAPATVELLENMEAAAKLFFSSPRFAVAGASQDQGKFGYKGPSPYVHSPSAMAYKL